MIAVYVQPPTTNDRLQATLRTASKQLLEAADRLAEFHYVESERITLPCGCDVFEALICLQDLEDAAKSEATRQSSIRLAEDILDEALGAIRSLRS